MTRATTLGTILFGGLLAALLFTCSGPVEHALRGDDDPRAKTPPTFATPAFAQTTTGRSLADVAERAVESVVNISSEKVVKVAGGQSFGPFFNDPFFEHFFGNRFRGQRGMPQERRERSLGSGVIVDEKQGVILTNNHVIEKATNVKVTLADGREFDAKVVGTDPASDIGVLKLEGDRPKDLRALPFGDSNPLRLGEVVLAVGNPFGVGQTVTMGIVSAKGRANVGIVDYEDFIQTDAAINPGNSGGALVNLAGELVGINTAILSRSGGYQGIGFAIPSNMARSIMESLLEHGKVVRGWLGVVIQDLDAELAKGLEIDTKRGVLIADVEKGSPAEKAGLERGDVVLTLDGKEVDSTNELRNLVAAAGAGRKTNVTILRDGETKELVVELGERPADTGEEQTIEPEEGALGGLTAASLTPQNRKRYRIIEGLDHGVVVTAVEPGTPAARAGFRPGDVIREVNRRRITSVADLKKVYREAESTVAVLVQRGRRTLFVALRKG